MRCTHAHPNAAVGLASGLQQGGGKSPRGGQAAQSGLRSALKPVPQGKKTRGRKGCQLFLRPSFAHWVYIDAPEKKHHLV